MIEPGQTVGTYTIEEQIGAGGMGAVYRARHTNGRAVAIKILLPQYSADAAIVQRFFTEARAASSIRHLGIVEIYELGMMPDGVAFIAMELLVGESLGKRIRDGRLALTPALYVARQICSALAAAHERGIVHRDLKPDNVFVVRDDDSATGERIKLLDFGIAKILGEHNEQNKTRTGTIMGTPQYMAPEQCRGEKVDHRADIYAVGCIVFDMVAKRPPFVGSGTGDVLASHIYRPAPTLGSLVPNLPSGLSELVDQLLAKDPANRLQSASAIVRAIDGVLGVPVGANKTPAAGIRPVALPAGVGGGPTPTTLSNASGASTQPPKAKSHRLAVGVALAAFAAIVALAVVVSSGGGGGPGAVTPAKAPRVDAAVVDAGVDSGTR